MFRRHLLKIRSGYQKGKNYLQVCQKTSFTYLTIFFTKSFWTKILFQQFFKSYFLGPQIFLNQVYSFTNIFSCEASLSSCKWNRKWSYPNRKWNYCSYFQASDKKKTSFTNCCQVQPELKLKWGWIGFIPSWSNYFHPPTPPGKVFLSSS